MTQYKCKTVNCEIVGVFGYKDKKNVSCEKHKDPEMIFTFQQNDFENIDIFDIQKPNRICIMKSCKTIASFNFLGNSKRLFCSTHKLETMIRVISLTCKCNNTSNHENCAECQKIYDKSRRNSKLGFLSNLVITSRQSASKRMNKGREEAGVNKIDVKILMNKWDTQKGLCYFSNIPMEHKTNTEWKASIERLNNDKGYIESNVVLVCYEFNHVLQWTVEKINLIPKLIKEDVIIDYDELLLIANKTKVRCPDSASKNSKIIITHLIKLIRIARGHIKARKQEINGNKFTITLIDIVNIFISQTGRCNVSGIPLRFDINKSWLTSLERNDTKKGYTKENVSLICREFNIMDRSVLTNLFDGHGGWSKSKFEIFYRLKFNNEI